MDVSTNRWIESRKKKSMDRNKIELSYSWEDVEDKEGG